MYLPLRSRNLSVTDRIWFVMYGCLKNLIKNVSFKGANLDRLKERNIALKMTRKSLLILNTQAIIGFIFFLS